ncbi:MAG: hypothetical protein IPO15_17665 [Anaerolineae bacterium]|nr:hypothetical protein [Anaerolineae bacterium]
MRQSHHRALADQGPHHSPTGTWATASASCTARHVSDKNCRPAQPEEIAGPWAGSLRVRWMLRISRHPVSLKQPVGKKEESTLGNFIEDENSPSPPDVAGNSLLREELLETPTPRERASCVCATAWTTVAPIRWKKWATSLA